MTGRDWFKSSAKFQSRIPPGEVPVNELIPSNMITNHMVELLQRKLYAGSGIEY